MKIRLVLAIAALWASGALAFNQADVEKLRSTGSCPKCDLSNFEFPDRAKFEKAILTSTNLSGSRLNKAILREANLRGANLGGTDLIGADLIGGRP
jgi:uncharacterized protein YjbI with pentapeptide repeats